MQVAMDLGGGPIQPKVLEKYPFTVHLSLSLKLNPLMLILVVSCDTISSCTPDSIQSDCILVGQHTHLQTDNELICSMYPNPANDFVDLQFATQKEQAVQYQLIDLTGRVHEQSSFQFIGQKSIRLETNAYPNGIYFLRIEGNDGNYKTEKTDHITLIGHFSVSRILFK